MPPKRAEKKKLKEKLKAAGQQHRAIEQLGKDSRRLEEEFALLLTNLCNAGQTKNLLSNALLSAKLGQINDVRIKMDTTSKTLFDYSQAIKDAKKAAKVKAKLAQIAKEELPSDDEDEPVKLDPAFEWQDLSHIPIPPDEAPETEGQIYKALLHLKTIKCKTLVVKKKSPQVPPPPPPRKIAFPHGPIFVPPIPTFVPSGLEGMQTPSLQSNVPFTMPFPTGRATPKHFPEKSQAPVLRHDPLNPDLDEQDPEVKVASRTVISAAPQMRDFKKEVTKMKPRVLGNNKS